MLVSTSKFLALLALVAAVAAAPQASPASSAADTTSSSEAQSIVPATTEVPTTTAPIVTSVPTITLITRSLSGSVEVVTKTIGVKTTLLPGGASMNPVGSASTVPYSFTPAVVSGAAATTPAAAAAATTTATKNGAIGKTAGGMGLAAIVGVAGVVAAVL